MKPSMISSEINIWSSLKNTYHSENMFVSSECNYRLFPTMIYKIGSFTTWLFVHVATMSATISGSGFFSRKTELKAVFKPAYCL